MQTRIKQIRKENKLTQQEFADKLGVSKNNIVNYENGRRSPSEAVINLISNVFTINYDWLKTGEGDMHAPQDEMDEIAEITTKLFHDSDPTRRKMAKFIFSLEEEDMEAIKRIWKKMDLFMQEEDK